MKHEFSEEQLKEIEDMVEFIPMLKAEGLNRLKIWKEFRDAGTKGYVILEAFRRTGLFKG